MGDASGTPDKPHLFKSTWNHRETKVIRVPAVIADLLLAIARRLDAGEPLEMVHQFILHSDLACRWDDFETQLQPVLEHLSLGDRTQVRTSLLQLLYSMHFQSQKKPLESQPVVPLPKQDSGQTFTPKKDEGVLPEWTLPQEKVLQYIQFRGVARSAEAAMEWRRAAWNLQTECYIAGIALLILDLLCKHQPLGSRAIEGNQFYSFAEMEQELFVLSVAGPPEGHHTLLRLYPDRVEGQPAYRFDSTALTIRHIERFMRVGHYLEQSMRTVKSETDYVLLACEALLGL
ncbi:hypothetical protein K9N68_39140 (plasmid) [Kovacikia minuta CCNUW1]|uniref:hypothetical protein n=1 Tax=Kovacikia minuta TaxID=2931930 RepID=UPI001CCC7690|nr:hypothetical protein [Kovacikia minuta]UBF30160.1 hypothetical protein K9N68_39140 [Kovacikia minuta CCNUW1]